MSISARPTADRDDAVPSVPSLPGLQPGGQQVLDALPDPALVLALAGDDGWHVVSANAAMARVGAEAVVGALLERSCTDELWTALEPRGSLSLVRELATGSAGLATITAGLLHGTARRHCLVTVREADRELASAELAEQQAEAAERALRGLRIVAQVSEVLADAQITEPLTAIAELLGTELVAWAATFAEHGTLEQIGTLGELPHRQRDLRRLRTDPEVPDPVADLMLRTAMTGAVIDLAAQHDPGTLTAELVDGVPRSVGRGSLWVLPVLGRDEVLGVLAVVPHERDGEHTAPGEHPTRGAGARFAGTDGGWQDAGTVLELVARRIGMAMDNAQFYEREHRLAETLQRAMLPAESTVDALDVWTYYAPSGEHAQVGGDWYDVLHVPDAGIGVVVGDVVGHDIEAAAVMGQLRSVVRAYAAEFLDPAGVLERVDHVVSGMNLERVASCLYANLLPQDDDSWRLSFSRAGHLPPVLVRDGDARMLDDANGPLIGFGGAQREVATATCLPGDVLVLYTDGLVERRDRPMLDGVTELLEVAAAVASGDAAGVGEELLMQLADAPEDDIAVVVVRVPDHAADPQRRGESPRQRRWQLPVEPRSTARARRAVVRAATAWGVRDVVPAELVVSELVSNAVLHGWGRVGVLLEETGGGLRFEVEDANPSPPVRRDRHAPGAGGYGLHIIERLAEWGWRPTPAGKVVWARLRTAQQEPPDGRG